MSKKCNLCGISQRSDLFMLCDIDEQMLQKALKRPYDCFFQVKNGKKRLIEKPNDTLKVILQKINGIFQELKCPTYCYSAYKGLSNIKNAQAHLGRKSILTLDISGFYTNTKAEYVEDFLANELGITGEALAILMKLTVCNGHIPTGAPTSPILAFWVHKKIFDDIYAKMAQNSIKMTLYVDDITLSSDNYIGNWAIKYCQNTIKKHGLWLKASKIKRFGYKKACITGVWFNQAKQKSVPHKLDFAFIKKLREKPISEMTEKDTRKLIGKIGYIQKIEPNKYQATKRKLIKRLKEVIKSAPMSAKRFPLT